MLRLEENRTKDISLDTAALPPMPQQLLYFCPIQFSSQGPLIQFWTEPRWLLVKCD